MPFAIITNGPTGSGKTGLIRKTLGYYGLQDKEYKTFLIDDLIENNEHYKKSIDDIINSECKDGTLCHALRDRLLDPTEELYAQFGERYVKYRGKTDERWCNDRKQTCDEFLDDMLDNAISDGENIVFETVGEYYVSWLVDKLPDYEIYYTFTLLDFCENIRRNKTRALDQIQAYVADRTKPAPRLPDVRISKFSMTVDRILKNLWNLMGRKLFGELSAVHRIIVFDNTTLANVVLYESETVQDINALFDAIKAIRTVSSVCLCDEL